MTHHSEAVAAIDAVKSEVRASPSLPAAPLALAHRIGTARPLTHPSPLTPLTHSAACALGRCAKQPVHIRRGYVNDEALLMLTLSAALSFGAWPIILTPHLGTDV